MAFETATEVFLDPFALESFDSDSAIHGEDRFIVLGRGGSAILSVVYAERGGIIRLISARRATRKERDDYRSENSQT